ncbi:non-heme iron oxygenase ferredoxin subunit [Lentibacillus lipolyticus]|nr:non-heme iron oxygenase ferredoxin subunit [Lentibacillus lipolyticus]
MQHTDSSDSISKSSYIYVCSSSELEENDLTECETETKTIVVGRSEGKVYAVDGICSHEYSELIDGELEDSCLICPLHFACFDIRDGSVLEGPAEDPLQTYDVIEKDGSIWVNDGKEE